jgi:hypothetical protein
MFGRDRILKSHLRQRFVITLKSGDAFEGVVLDADARVLVVADASAQTANGPAKVDGQLFVERADVAYLQLPIVSSAVVGEIVK